MIVHIDARSAVPVFEQLRAQIERLIGSGQLSPGSRLPPIRQLADDLGLARGTINKVYDQLANDGLIVTSGRHGTVVVDKPKVRSSPTDLAAAATTLAIVARQLGISDARAHAALDHALGEL